MTIYRAENVGSFLRPRDLLLAREDRRQGRIDSAAFKTVEDRAVDDCIALQEGAGLDVITDGEMRRNLFASQLVEASDGFDRVEGATVSWFTLDGEEEKRPQSVGLVSKIRPRRHLSAEEFVYLRGKAKRPTKITLPSPTMYAYYWVPGVSDNAYPTTDAYLEDVASILNDEIEELIRLGALNIQFDAPELGMTLDPVQQQWFASKGFEPETMIEQGVELMNGIIEAQKGATDVRFALHICRGNEQSHYMAKGSYQKLAQRVFARTQAHTLLLEYDDERSGDFQPLRNVPGDTAVVLGLVTTKTARQESDSSIKERIQEASTFVDKERLALSTQCGFASVAQGNAVSPEVQSAKLEQIVRVARDVWPD